VASSGITTFNLDIEELTEQAFSLVGGELTSGEDARQARIALNLLLIDLQNQGHPLAKLENVKFSTVGGEPGYQLPSDTIDVMSAVVTRDGTDTTIERIPLFSYHKIATKDQEGLPTQFALDRDKNAVSMFLYLTPENSTDSINLWILKKIETVNNPAGENVDVSTRYLPALVFGLAYYLSMKRDVNIQKRSELKANYDMALRNAFEEDRERAGYKVVPHSYKRGR